MFKMLILMLLSLWLCSCSFTQMVQEQETKQEIPHSPESPEKPVLSEEKSKSNLPWLIPVSVVGGMTGVIGLMAGVNFIWAQVTGHQSWISKMIPKPSKVQPLPLSQQEFVNQVRARPLSVFSEVDLQTVYKEQEQIRTNPNRSKPSDDATVKALRKGQWLDIQKGLKVENKDIQTSAFSPDVLVSLLDPDSELINRNIHPETGMEATLLTPLGRVIQTGAVETFKLFLKHPHIDVNKEIELFNGKTPLETIIDEIVSPDTSDGRRNVLDQMLRALLDMNDLNPELSSRSSKFITPLHKAIIPKYVSMGAFEKLVDRALEHEEDHELAKSFLFHYAICSFDSSVSSTNLLTQRLEYLYTKIRNEDLDLLLNSKLATRALKAFTEIGQQGVCKSRDTPLDIAERLKNADPLKNTGLIEYLKSKGAKKSVLKNFPF